MQTLFVRFRQFPLLRGFAAALLTLGWSAPLAAQSPARFVANLVRDVPVPTLASGSPVPVVGIPVAGVGVEQLHDSFLAPRSEGRTHLAMDIHAPRGTPVLAAADGAILRLDHGRRGGNCLYQLDRNGRVRFYYAHLDRFAEGVRPGLRVQRGDTIGYVGDTGNAAPGDYHLHFSVAVLSNVGRWWEGRTLNPYPLMRRFAAPSVRLATVAAPRIHQDLR